MQKMNSVVFLLILILLFLNAIIFPTFTEKHVGINSSTILFLYCLFITVLKIFNKPILPNCLQKIVIFALFPLVLISSFVFFVLEKTQYSNYVFQHFHIFPYLLVYVVVLCALVTIFSVYKYKSTKEISINLFFFASFATLAYLQVSNIELFSSIIKEDSFLEYLQFAFYLISGFIALKISRCFKKKVVKDYIRFYLFLLLSIGLFFIAFEEISWGQRLIGIDTPELIAEINLQKEINIHNLSFFQYEKTYIMYILLGLYGSFSRKIVLWLFPSKKWLTIFTPDKRLFPFFFFVFLVYFDRMFLNLNINTPSGLSLNLLPWQEIAEGYLSLGLLVYLYSSYKEAV